MILTTQDIPLPPWTMCTTIWGCPHVRSVSLGLFRLPPTSLVSIYTTPLPMWLWGRKFPWFDIMNLLAATGDLIAKVCYYTYKRMSVRPLFEILSISANIHSFSFWDLNALLFYYVLWCSLMFYDVLWCFMMFYAVLWCSMMFYDVLWSSIMFFDVPWCSMMFHVLRALLVFFCRGVPLEFLQLFFCFTESRLIWKLADR